MIIYGWKSTGIGQASIPEPCSSCGTENSVHMFVYKKYVHVFWIPIFPYGNTAVTECDHCKQVLKKGEFPSNYKERYERVKSDSKNPIWTWTGLALLSVLIVWSTITSGKHQEELNVYATSPQVEDLYTWHFDGEYTLARVVKVTHDSVYIQFHEYSINKPHRVHRILNEHPDGFSKDIEALPIAEIPDLLEDNTIYTIKREE